MGDFRAPCQLRVNVVLLPVRLLPRKIRGEKWNGRLEI